MLVTTVVLLHLALLMLVALSPASFGISVYSCANTD